MRIVTETASRSGFELVQPADLIARFFLAGFDGLTMQRLYAPNGPAESAGLQALVSATVALAGGGLNLAAVQTQ